MMMDQEFRRRVLQIAETATAQEILTAIGKLADLYVNYFQGHGVPISIKTILPARHDNDSGRVRMWWYPAENQLLIEERNLPENPRLN